MREDSTGLIPAHKADVLAAAASVAQGWPAVAPFVEELLGWVRDLNWPVAAVLAPFLSSIGEPLAPQVRVVMQGDDEGWKYSLIQAVITPSMALARALEPELRRIAFQPTDAERREQVDEVAHEALSRL